MLTYSDVALGSQSLSVPAEFQNQRGLVASSMLGYCLKG